MSLLSHPLPLLYFGLSVISAAVEQQPAVAPAPQAPAAPGSPRAPAYTKEQLALEPVKVLFRNCALVTRLELELLNRATQEPGQQTPSEDLAKFRKEHQEKLEAAWREIARVQENVRVMTLEPETEVLATPAHKMYLATKEVSELTQKMIKIQDAPPPVDSKALLALIEKAKPVAKLRREQETQAIEQMMRVGGDVVGAEEAAAKAGPAPAAKPGQIVPGKKEAELPPGMTRGKYNRRD